MGASLKIPSSLDRRAAIAGMGFCAALLLGGASALFYFFQLHPWLQSRAAQAWAQVPCRIIQCQLNTHTSSGKSHSQSYDLSLDYRYTVGGATQEATTYDFTMGATSDYDWWASAAQYYQPGMAAVCYVNPQNPASAVLVRDFDRNTVAWVFVFVLGAPGLGLVAWTIYRAMRRLKFGESVLELASAPAALGGPLSGRIALGRPAQPPEGFALTLKCIHRVVIGSGKSRQVTEEILWQEDKQVPDMLGDSVPVAFALPASGTATDSADKNDCVCWRLHAAAKMPGVDYAAEFEVPVVGSSRLASTPGMPYPGMGAMAMRAAPIQVPEENDAQYHQPAGSRIRVADAAGGKEFYFPAFRNRGCAVYLALFTLLWTGIVWVIFHYHGPRLFAVVFGGFDVVLVLWVLHEWFATTRVVARRGSLTLTKHLFGVGRTRELAGSDILEINIVHGETYNQRVLYNIQVVFQNGRKVTAGDEVPDMREAHWLALEMARCVGLKG